eukprot:scaffold3170_cov128-Cylindrotheca_fusiformis.AAC.18
MPLISSTSYINTLWIVVLSSSSEQFFQASGDSLTSRGAGRTYGRPKEREFYYSEKTQSRILVSCEKPEGKH